ncbi:MAG: hypothetical protein FWC39_05790 [Bacteroidetes bacterium]|nr:hypothetical protein [Bacteroidota bacterium]
MKYTLSIIFTLFFFLTYGQDTVFIKYNTASRDNPVSYKIDTLPHAARYKIMYGTQVIPATENQMEATIFKLYLKDATLTPCRNLGEYFPPPSVENIEETAEKLDVTIQFTANCSHEFLCDMEIIDEKTINLIYIGYGGYAQCGCCFGLTYHIEKLKNEDWQTEEPGYLKLEDIIINGQEYTRRKIR